MRNYLILLILLSASSCTSNSGCQYDCGKLGYSASNSLVRDGFCYCDTMYRKSTALLDAEIELKKAGKCEHR